MEYADDRLAAAQVANAVHVYRYEGGIEELERTFAKRHGYKGVLVGMSLLSLISLFVRTFSLFLVVISCFV